MIATDPEHVKTAIDVLSISTVFATFLTTWMPPLAATASFIWAILRIYETNTVQNFLKRLTNGGE